MGGRGKDGCSRAEAAPFDGPKREVRTARPAAPARGQGGLRTPQPRRPERSLPRWSLDVTLLRLSWLVRVVCSGLERSLISSWGREVL